MLRRSVTPRFALARGLHASAARRNEGPPQSPLKVFFDTFKSEVKKSNELKTNIKALQDETGRVADSEAFRKAKEAFDRAQKGSSAAGKVVKRTADAVGGVAVKAWDSPVGKGVRTTVHTSAELADRAFEPVRNTQVYRDVSEVIDDGSSTSYGGFLTKEQRVKLRQRELEAKLRSGSARPVRENEDAGGALVATEHKSGPSLHEKWDDFKATTRVGRAIATLREKWDESENGLVSLVRTIVEKVAGFFAETEQAKVIKQFKLMDPSFRLTDFQKTLTNYIVPELLDAYIKNDAAVLKHWLSEAPFNVWQANNKQFVEQGLFSDGRILDIRGVDVVTCKLLQPNDVPVMVVSCRAQEIHLFRKAKTGEVAAGTEDDIQLSTYAMVLTRVPEEFDDEVTDGWKVVEFARGGVAAVPLAREQTSASANSASARSSSASACSSRPQLERAMYIFECMTKQCEPAATVDIKARTVLGGGSTRLRRFLEAVLRGGLRGTSTPRAPERRATSARWRALRADVPLARGRDSARSAGARSLPSRPSTRPAGSATLAAGSLRDPRSPALAPRWRPRPSLAEK